MNLSALAARFAGARPKKTHIALPLLLTAALYSLSSIPGTPRSEDPAAYALFYWVPPSVQNILHIPAYVLLASAWHWALSAWRCGTATRAIAACTIASAYGVLDEWHQSFVPGRYASFTDVALNIAGAILGIWLAAWIASRTSAARRQD